MTMDTKKRVDTVLKNPAACLQLSSFKNDEHLMNLLEEFGIYVYLNELIRVCAYIKVALSARKNVKTLID